MRTHVSIMREVYHDLRRETQPMPLERACRLDVEILRTMNLMHNQCQVYWENHRRLEKRLALHRALRDSSIGGKVIVIESGMDCDGVQYTGRHHTIDASIKAFDALYERIAEYADGPFHLWPVSPERAAEIHYVSRDRTLEAFEDGHAHCIHTGSL